MTGALSGASSPADVVRGYFAALARSDAPAALAYGEVPSGPRTYLTSAALREAQRQAPITDVTVEHTRVAAGRAKVEVRYTLGFAHRRTFDGDTSVLGHLTLHRSGKTWRLDATAIATRLVLARAAQRATLAGGVVPTGRTLLFPGAVPLRFDTPYLEDGPTRAVGFDAGATTSVTVVVSADGRTAMRGAVLAALRSCLRGGGVTCPQPAGRYVPGSLRGSASGDLNQLRIGLEPGAAGVIDLDATIAAEVAYRRLDFRDQAVAGHGVLTLAVHALAGARSPLTIRWTG